MHIETICRVDLQLDVKMCRRDSTEKTNKYGYYKYLGTNITTITITTKLHEIETNLLSERLTNG